jgi:hypothetical protein
MPFVDSGWVTFLEDEFDEDRVDFLTDVMTMTLHP